MLLPQLQILLIYRQELTMQVFVEEGELVISFGELDVPFFELRYVCLEGFDLGVLVLDLLGQDCVDLL